MKNCFYSDAAAFESRNFEKEPGFTLVIKNNTDVSEGNGEPPGSCVLTRGMYF